MISNLEERVGKKLLAPDIVGQEPLAARKEGRLHPFVPQIIDNPAVIAADFIRLLAQIESQSDDLLIGREPHAPYDAAQPWIDGRERSKRAKGGPAECSWRPFCGLPIVRRPAQLGRGPAHCVAGAGQSAATRSRQE